jgi:hypothetical protein
MYQFISVARSLSDTIPSPMYIYINEDDNKYYISNMYPRGAVFQGSKLTAGPKYYNVDNGQLISTNDIKNGKTTYWNIDFKFKI